MAEEKSPYTVKTEGTIKYLIIDCRGSTYGPSIADYPQRMSEVIGYLGKTDADRIVLAEVYERVYDEDQTRMLKQLAELLQKFRVKGVWSPQYLGGDACSAFLPTRHDLVVNIASDLLRTDPIRAYMKCIQAIQREKAQLPQLPPEQKECTQTFLTTLEYIKANFEATDLIQQLKGYVRKLKKLPPGRGFYHTVFEAQLKPSFIGSRLMFKLPAEIELLDQYEVKGTRVTIYKHPEKIEYLYHINPPEYSLTPEHYFLLSKTKEIVSEYHPEGLEFTELATSKDYFMRIYETTIADIARQNGIEVSHTDIQQLARIVARYTIGFGMMGLLLSDERLTDVYIDAPLGQKPVYIVHSDYGPCQTNVFFSEEEANSVVSRFRSLSGRPFDEAHSVLDFDLHEYHTRTCTIGQPLSPDGVAFALRLHKGTPWTLPQFIDVKMVTNEVAGLLSFLIDAQASSLIVGSRGSGKTSLLMSLMLEILPSLRVITIEDTLELPVEYMRKTGYNICRLKTRSAISVGAIASEVSPEDALRTALRLGDSVLIMGEVRSKEALVLYEAMRVGAVGNVVMGTIHAENAYSVWDRVVNDLGVPNTSFKATDMCIVSAPIRFKGALQKTRRLVEITEVGKTWYEDPGREGGLIDLMTYDATNDVQTVHKDNIFENSQFFKKIQRRRGMDIDMIWEDIQHRASSKQFLVDMKNEYKIPTLLEARYTVRMNDKYLLMQELSRQELGSVDYPKVLEDWKQWVKDGFVKELVSRRDALAKVKPAAKKE
ncbi:MAG: type II/IV secretion system ATPase subunit [Candidatus Diapherotrites archaeon]|nr:type II/IV secretion system ATPase subunit [Candidatus Diapherotrites archaeon]